MEKKQSFCGICSAGCPMDVYVEDGKVVEIEGHTENGKSRGLCAKGAASKQYLYNEERILYPMKRVGEKGSGQFERISWEEAYGLIAKKLSGIRKEYGAKSVVFYAGYPKWYRPALLRFANAFGSPNFCTESSTCFQASALAWKSIYGNGICFPDLPHTKTLLLWTSNLFHSNTPMGKMYRSLKKRGVTIIAVDPRSTVTTREADIHLKITPGTDGALALAMAHVIIEEELYDKEFVDKYVYGFQEYKNYVSTFTPERACEITGADAELIRKAARLYAYNKPSGIQFSVSTIVHHINGFQNYRAVFSLIALTGNYDVEGGNRAMPEPVSPCNEFGKVKRYDGEEAIGEKDFPIWFDLPCQEAQCTRIADYILEEEPYPVKAVFAMGLNHRMWPQPNELQRAFGALDFYVNVELFWSESSRMADLVLPACTTFEREEVKTLRGGMFALNERMVEPLGESKNDIEIIMELAKRIGLEDEVLSSDYESYMDYILKPSGLTLQDLREHPEGMKGKVLIPPRIQTYREEPFHTKSGKIELYSLALDKYRESRGYEPLPVYHDFRDQRDVDREMYPLILSTGARKPQFFHARLYRLSWLSALETNPAVEIHPEDARKYGIKDGDRVRVSSPAGEMEGIAVSSINGNPGVVYIYHGNPKGEANNLIHRSYFDPYTGFPGYKSYFCNIEKLDQRERKRKEEAEVTGDDGANEI